MYICNIQIYHDIDPFFLEDKIISVQRLWRFKMYHRHKYLIIKNFNIYGNIQDPISLNKIINNNKKIKNINNIFPIFRNTIMYIYEISSLKNLLENNSNEVYTNTKFTQKEINKINILSKNIVNSIDVKYTELEQLYFLKSSIFQKFYELKTYFTLDLYETINKKDLFPIFTELKLMWNTFKIDNNIQDNKILNKKLDWNNNIDIEKKLLNNINILINCNVEDNFKKHICYLIIGAFSYVDKNIKNIYNNIDFI